MIKFKTFILLNEDSVKTYGGKPAGKFDTNKLDVVTAKEIALLMLKKNNIAVDTVFPKFSENFQSIKYGLSKSLGLQRKEMPVILSWQVDDFKKHLDKEKIKNKIIYQPVGDLKPIQGQIYFDKLIDSEIEFGGMKHGSKETKKTIITSKDGYIIDGHHRWATAMLTDPTIKVKTLSVDMDIHHLLEYAMQYGDSIGNIRNK